MRRQQTCRHCHRPEKAAPGAAVLGFIRPTPNDVINRVEDRVIARYS